MIQSFDVSKAAFHFASVGKRPWRIFALYWLTYLGVWITAFTVMSMVMLGFISAFSALAGPDAFIPANADAPFGAPLFGVGLAFLFVVFLCLTALIWAVIETAGLRYFLEGRFKLRVGREEFRTLSIGLTWFLFSVILVGSAIALNSVLVLAGLGGLQQTVLTVLVLIAALGVFCGFGVLYAPASALTFESKRVSFLRARSITKERYWSLFGAFAIIVLISFAASFAVDVLSQMSVLAAVQGQLDALQGQQSGGNLNDLPGIIIAFFFNPIIVGGVLIYSIASGLVSAFQAWAFLGINVLAVKTRALSPANGLGQQ